MRKKLNKSNNQYENERKEIDQLVRKVVVKIIEEIRSQK
jgi:hypothetical protein